jgi:hypothetical protein
VIVSIQVLPLKFGNLRVVPQQLGQSNSTLSQGLQIGLTGHFVKDRFPAMTGAVKVMRIMLLNEIKIGTGFAQDLVHAVVVSPLECGPVSAPGFVGITIARFQEAQRQVLRRGWWGWQWMMMMIVWSV